jgi:hypothetical protein
MRIANPGVAAVCGVVLATQVCVSAGTSEIKAEPLSVEPGAGTAPVYGVTLPPDYRRWELVSVSYQAPFDEFRGILGNSVAIAAYREGRLPFPDGSVLVKLAWKRVPSAEFYGAFVPGAATTVQVMVKDSGKYAATGGWGFGRFTEGVPADAAQHLTCFACHEAHVQRHDFVFTRWAR